MTPEHEGIAIWKQSWGVLIPSVLFSRIYCASCIRNQKKYSFIFLVKVISIWGFESLEMSGRITFLNLLGFCLQDLCPSWFPQFPGDIYLLSKAVSFILLGSKHKLFIVFQILLLCLNHLCWLTENGLKHIKGQSTGIGIKQCRVAANLILSWTWT